MSQLSKQIIAVLSGMNDNNIRFNDLCNVLNLLGFKCRIKGDHHIYFKDGVKEIINLQPLGSKAKAYQVKQVRNLIIKYKLGGSVNV